MRKVLFGFLCGSVCIMAGQVQAEDFKLPAHKKWLAIASSKDLDVAIGIARSMGENTKVVASLSGYYGVIKGPYAAATLEKVKSLDPNIGELPKDALLSNGARYLKTVWETPVASAPMIEYQINKPAHLSVGDLSVELKLVEDGEDQFSSVVTGTEKNGPGFSFTVGKGEEFSPAQPQAAFLVLDKSTAVPQLVFTRYSGGAHCCTKTWIAVKPNGAASWSLVEAANLDGGGYWFEDVDGDGSQELLSSDNSFYYSFDSYAGSFAPIKISQLRNGILQDVTDEDAMKPRLKQDLAGLEYAAKLDPQIWKSNGFLAAWAASKMRLGQGEEAWQTVKQNMAEDTGFGPQECTSGQAIEECPSDNLKPLPILKGLADFLKENGYGPLPDAAEALLH